MAKTKIEWTQGPDGTPGMTWNPTRGCDEIAPGCAHCYAKTFAERFRGVPGHPYEQGFDPRTAPDQLALPLEWKKPRRIFVDSMSDLFHESFPFEYIAACFGVMAACQRHTFQVLTKRPARAVQFFRWIADQAEELRANVGEEPPSGHAEPSACALFLSTVTGEPDLLRDVQHAAWPLPNVWIGTSIANQIDADKNIQELIGIPAAVRFLSIEPLISLVDLYVAMFGAEHPWRGQHPEMRGMNSLSFIDGIGYGLDWVIVGGESGQGARPCNLEWVRSIVAQCAAGGVPCFVKQLGSKPYSVPDRITYRHNVIRMPQGFSRFLNDRKGGDIAEFPADLRVRQFPEVSA